MVSDCLWHFVWVVYSSRECTWPECPTLSGQDQSFLSWRWPVLKRSIGSRPTPTWWKPSRFWDSFLPPFGRFDECQAGFWDRSGYLSSFAQFFSCICPSTQPADPSKFWPGRCFAIWKIGAQIVKDRLRSMQWSVQWKKSTTLQSVMNGKLSKHRFWHCNENDLIKAIQTIPHKL